MAKSHKSSQDWRQGTKRRMIAELAERGSTKRQAFAELRLLVIDQIEPMIFRANVAGHRVPKPISEQLIELKNEIGRVYAILGRAVSSDFDSEEIEQTETEEIEELEEISDTEDTEESEEIEETKKPVKAASGRIENARREFFDRWNRLRLFCKSRDDDSNYDPIDDISVRPLRAANRMIAAGVPVDCLIHSMIMHWPADVKRDSLAHGGVMDFDVTEFSKRILKERGISEITRENGEKEKPHSLFGYVLILAECRIPIMLVGPAGTGKSYLAGQLADYMGLRYGETPMSPGATRGDLLGRHTIGGFISAQYVELYGGGGIFNLEEIDAADASMLIVINNALESGKLFNSSSGETVVMHDDFVVMSTANTFGLGANRKYVGRERLDFATLDRFRMGRVYMDLDLDIAKSMIGIK